MRRVEHCIRGGALGGRALDEGISRVCEKRGVMVGGELNEGESRDGKGGERVENGGGRGEWSIALEECGGGALGGRALDEGIGRGGRALGSIRGRGRALDEG